MARFTSRLEPDANGYFPAGPAAAIGPDQMISVDLPGETVIITRYEGSLYAFCATCPHAAADLRRGSLYRGRIDCPDHGYRFDVRDGRILWPPDEVYRLKRFEVLEVDGQVKIKPLASPSRR